MDDHRILETLRRRLDGVAGEWLNMAPTPEATALAWAFVEHARELLLSAPTVDTDTVGALEDANAAIEIIANPLLRARAPRAGPPRVARA